MHFDALANAAAVQAGKLPPEQLGVSAPDGRTVLFSLTRSAALPQLLLLPVAYPVYLPALQRFGEKHTRPVNLVSNGAYRLQAWRPQASLTLVRNPRFRERALIAGVVYQVTEDAASELQRFQAGGLHITETVQVVVEQVFGIPGVGRYFVQGALNRDYTLVLGVVLVIGAAIVLINAVVDVPRSRLDPRLRDAH